MWDNFKDLSCVEYTCIQESSTVYDILCIGFAQGNELPQDDKLPAGHRRCYKQCPQTYSQ